MVDPTDITVWLALWAGVLSFISPCTLPLFPAYLSYITGISVQDLQQSKSPKIRAKVMSHSLFFLLGVSSVFMALGFGASFVGELISGFLTGSSGLLIQKLSGIFIVLIGLFLIGFLKWDWLMQERRFQFATKPAGYLGTTLVGMGFAAGWTPCIGPIFAAILILAANNPAQGLTYTSFYIVGFALPFMLLSFYISTSKWIMKYSTLIMKIGGAMMIVMGILLYTGQLARLSSWILQLMSNVSENVILIRQ
ncbi:cytochrome c biogenesis protein CcdA [Caldalkalibacillus thermarum TA2.A1]|uniref:Cytochrome c biogenesis protein CcdA n=1 Tax=Caldalkalibacillus thermarum (strain TA2.A1) TaxID=986075 RepID=A0A8X8I6N5_CALTT|nr:cytochrome c biogenesis protein CcdA [Caldalkalibacillus thermarum]QZT32552.1 cytochrome c biogenesis protein CcdA [Caldalkalibacillus thermarum TA2.A1]